MRRTLLLVVLLVLLIAALVLLWASWMLTTNRVTLAPQSKLPTAVPGLSTKDQDYQTPISKRTRTPTPGGPTSTPAPFATRIIPTPVVVLPPQVPHSLAGKADCMYCHIGNTYFAVPADHRNRPNQTCLGCHRSSETSAYANPPAIPHSVEGRDNCLLCHFMGQNGAQPIPSSHTERGNDSCRSCHRVK